MPAVAFATLAMTTLIVIFADGPAQTYAINQRRFDLRAGSRRIIRGLVLALSPLVSALVTVHALKAPEAVPARHGQYRCLRLGQGAARAPYRAPAARDEEIPRTSGRCCGSILDLAGGRRCREISRGDAPAQCGDGGPPTCRSHSWLRPACWNTPLHSAFPLVARRPGTTLIGRCLPRSRRSCAAYPAQGGPAGRFWTRWRSRSSRGSSRDTTNLLDLAPGVPRPAGASSRCVVDRITAACRVVVDAGGHTWRRSSATSPTSMTSRPPASGPPGQRQLHRRRHRLTIRDLKPPVRMGPAGRGGLDHRRAWSCTRRGGSPRSGSTFTFSASAFEILRRHRNQITACASPRRSPRRARRS